MPRILSPERVIEYSVEFKVKVVRLTNELDVKAIDIAKALNLHPMMIYRLLKNGTGRSAKLVRCWLELTRTPSEQLHIRVISGQNHINE